MSPRSPRRRRAGMLLPHALLSALVVSQLLIIGSAGAASLTTHTAGGATPPGWSPSDTTYDGWIWIGARPSPPCAGQPVSISIDACGCNVDLQSAYQSLGGAIQVRAVIRPEIVCAQCDPRSLRVPIGLLAAGNFEIAIDRILTIVHENGSIDSSETRTMFRFSVTGDCPPPSGVRYLDGVRIGTPSPCLECPPTACAGDSIPVFLHGVFPDNCTRFKEVRLLPSPIATPLPAPPLVQIVYAINSCIRPPCLAVLSPWEANVLLPPLPGYPGGVFYQLLVNGVIEDDCDSRPPEPVGNANFPFTVTEPCSTVTQKCFRPSFVHSGEACDATFGSDHPASVTFQVATSVPLAGLQGVFSLDSPALEVVNIEAIGVAASMHLTWTRELGGAKFVLLSYTGAPIASPLDVVPPAPVPVLRVDVAPNPLVDVPLPAVAHLAFDQLLASDGEGQGVPECPPYPYVREDRRARICAESFCDHNGDGGIDVRDLVLMVRCVTGTGTCPDPITALDCDRNQHVDLDDVLCCAHVLLGGQASDSLPGRPEPLVTARLDPPILAESGLIEVPLRLGGTDRVGAARFELRYPSSRYEIASIEAPHGSQWLALSQGDRDKIVLAMIGLPSIELTVGGHESWVVRLRPRTEQVRGGAIALTSAQFSGPDGVGLVTSVAPQSVPLGAVGSIALSDPRPNPFGGETAFSVNLVSPSQVEIAVFDLAGRRVSTVFRGVAPAGVSDFAWRGIRDDGSRVPGGMYFVRVTSAGRQLGHKVLFVPGAP